MFLGLLVFIGAGFAQTAVVEKSDIGSDTTGSTQLGSFSREVVVGGMPRIDRIGTHGLGIIDFHPDPTCSPGRRTFLNRIIPHFIGNLAHLPPGMTEPAMSFRISDIFHLVHRRKSR